MWVSFLLRKTQFKKLKRFVNTLASISDITHSRAQEPKASRINHSSLCNLINYRLCPCFLKTLKPKITVYIFHPPNSFQVTDPSRPQRE